MATEGSVVIGDPVQGTLDSLRHGRSGPLAGGGRLAVASAEPDGRRELLGDRAHLVARAVRTPGIVETFGLVQLVAEVAEPLLVGRLRRRVEDRQALAAIRPLAA